MNILVLGASGQIGSVLYNNLKEKYAVTGTSRKGSQKYLQFDPFRDNWSVLGKPDVLINCVGQIVASPQSSYHHIHVDLTRRILAHRQDIGNPRIVQISALGASDEHPVEFLKTKGIADALLLQHPDTAVVRPSVVCTPQTMIIKKLTMLSNVGRLLFGAIPVPRGFMQTRIQPIMGEDLVELVRNVCLNRDIKIVDAVGPEVFTFQDIIRMLAKSRNQKLRTVDIPKSITDVAVKGLLSRVLPNVISAQQYQLLFYDNIGSVDACKQLLGRMPLSTRDFFHREFAS